MCGRITIPDPREQQHRIGFVDVHETRPLPAMPRFNVAPAQTVPAPSSRTPGRGDSS